MKRKVFLIEIAEKVLRPFSAKLPLTPPQIGGPLKNRVFQGSLIVIGLISLVALCLPLSPKVQAVSINSLEPAAGGAGQLVRLVGVLGGCSHHYELYWDKVAPENLLTRGKGTACAYVVIQFRVPQSPKGRHRVILVDVDYRYAEASYDFTVMPALTASPDRGTTGTTVTVTGNGFAPNESDIQVTYDTTIVQKGIKADAKGSWTTTINIPESPKGAHPIQASGLLTTAAEVIQAPFTVTPKVNLEPNSGGAGVSITAIGTGFGAAETDIKIIFDKQPIRTGIQADNLGSFRANVTIPGTAAKGEHIIDASGASTQTTEVPDVIFTVGTVIMLQPATGYVGDKVTVDGSGFAANETGIKVTYDGIEIVGGITANLIGSWTATFSVPPSSAGSHLVRAFGTNTQAQEVRHQAFTILPRLVLNPTSGEVGTRIVATGTGFGERQPVTISYNDTEIALDLTTDFNGNFTATFEAPPSLGEKHQVNARDGAGNQAVATFFTETSPPPVPSPTSPPPEAKIGFVGRQIVTFSWAPVTDPSGVTYSLEISKQTDFTTPILRRTGLVKTEYTLAEMEALEPGDYYWRVKAIDGAGNESNWTPPQPITVSRITMTTLVIVLGVLVLLLLVILWRLLPAGGGKPGQK